MRWVILYIEQLNLALSVELILDHRFWDPETDVKKENKKTWKNPNKNKRIANVICTRTLWLLQMLLSVPFCDHSTALLHQLLLLHFMCFGLLSLLWVSYERHAFSRCSSDWCSYGSSSNCCFINLKYWLVTDLTLSSIFILYSFNFKCFNF